MKLLKVVANNFKLCEDNFTICFVPTARKTEEDKEYELQEIDENLFVFNTLAFVGKNASGKTTTMELLSFVYDILSNFRIKNNINLITEDLNIDITFYNEGILYHYVSDIKKRVDNVLFSNQRLFSKKYIKTGFNDIFNYDKYEEIIYNDELPEDTSILFRVLKKISIRGVYFKSQDVTGDSFDFAFDLYDILKDVKPNLIKRVLKLYDEHISNIEKKDNETFKITYNNNKSYVVNGHELFSILSSGTTKGLTLFSFVILSLHNGFDLIIDEIENHFHRTLVENIILLYKDKKINKNNASIIITTHYPELLDLFNRSDNVYVTKYDKKIHLENLNFDYNVRSELLKSKKFFQNAYGTNISYEALMEFKEELM
ncbi:MAG: AAA family ATPase [Bacilli bacterium]